MRSTYSEEFAKRLRDIRIEKGWTQAELGSHISVSNSTVSAWESGDRKPDINQLRLLCRVLNISSDWLLDIKTSNKPSIVKSLSGIEWTEGDFQDLLTEDNNFIKQGVRFFEFLVQEQGDWEDIKKNPIFTEYSLPAIQASISQAFRYGAIRISSITRNHSAESQLQGKFPGLRCVVALTPPKLTKVILSEIVAFLAASHVISRVSYRPYAVDLGSGYTIARMAEQTVPNLSQFTNTLWTPLSSFPKENLLLQASNYICLLMANRNTTSRALYLPFVGKDEEAMDEVTTAWKRMDLIFMTVNGFGHSASDGTQYNFARVSSELQEKGMGKQVAGELLGLMLDDQGNLVGTEQTIEKFKSEVFQIDLDSLRQIVRQGRVWIVAAGLYKARAVLMAIRNGLANSLVIDDEIAGYLLRNA